MSFTSAQIVAAFKAWGVAKQVLGAIDPVTLAEFYTSSAIGETDALLAAELKQLGKTVDDLKKTIADLRPTA